MTDKGYYIINSVLAQVDYNIHNLAGKGRKELRHELIFLTTGERYPLKKCGINTLINVLLEAYQINQGHQCRAVDLQQLTNAIKTKAENIGQ